jgi:lysophospholipase L1-like esterase
MRRVLVIGDSVTFGSGAPEEASFSRRLEAMLREQLACPLEVVNAGVSGYNTTKELDYFANEGQLVEPDVVLVYHVENDKDITHPMRGRSVAFLKDWIGYRSYVVNATLYAYRMLRWRLQAQAAGGDRALYEEQQRLWGTLPGAQESLDGLHRIGALARDKGMRVVLASHPNNLDASVDAERNRLLREVAERGGMRFVDSAPAFQGHPPDDLAVSATDRHPNALGHQLIASQLLPAVRDALGCELLVH